MMKFSVPVAIALAIGLPACATPATSRDDGRSATPHDPSTTPTSEPPKTSSAAESASGSDDATEWSGGWISGQVSDEQGMPVPSARIRAACRSGGAAIEHREVVADAAGHWWLSVKDSASADLTVFADDYLPAQADGVSLVAGERRGGANVVLERGVAISGRVTSEDGQPIAGFAVTVESDGVTRRGRTLPGGEFSVHGLRAGSECVVDVADASFHAAGGEALLPRRVVAPASRVDLAVTRASRFRVRCVDSETGELLSNAWGALQAGDDEAAGPAALELAWERGAILEFGLDVRPGSYRLFATSRGCETASPRDVVLGDSEASTDVTLPLARKKEIAAGSLRVTPHDDRGVPLSGTFLWVQRTRMGSERTALADADAPRIVAQLLDQSERSIFGREVVPSLEPGTYRATVFSDDEWLRPAVIDVTIAPNEAACADVTLPRTGRLAVSVEDPRGDPVVGYLATVQDAKGDAVCAVFDSAGDRAPGLVRRNVLIAQPGFAVADDLLPGHYTLTVEKQGAPPRRRTIEVFPGETSFIHVPLEVKPR